MANSHSPPKPNEKNPAYPEKLKQTELRLLRMRRGLSDHDAVKHRVGFGLSGGGIRSATFCLGVFQGLARQKLLSKIDYLSTVSGGGYFGAFYGRLFTREQITNMSDVEDILAVRAANEEESNVPAGNKFPKGKVFRWLRENGRYLAPSGSGDVLLGGAVMIRNFIAVQLVLGTFILMLFLGAQLVRGEIEVLCQVGQESQCWWWGALQKFLNHLPGGKSVIWWSPYAALIAILFLFFVIPPAWCYWLVEKPNRRTAGRWIPPFWGWLAVVVLSLLGIGVGWSTRSKKLVYSGNEHDLFWVAVVVLAVAAETMIWGLLSGYFPRFASHKNESNEKLIFDDENVRLRLSLQLRTALVVIGVVLGFVVIDSVAQTLYGAALLDQFRPGLWLTAILGPLIALAGFGRTIVSASSSKANGKRYSVPMSLLAGATAFIIAALLLITLDAFSYMIAWKNNMPLGPRPDWTISQRLDEAKRIEVKPISVEEPKLPQCANQIATPVKNPATEGWQITAEKSPAGDFDCGSRHSQADLIPVLGALAITAIFSFLFGWSWPFLNRSTHQTIYTSRLIRAYLGASNPSRLKQTGGSVTETISNDDINQEEYWPRFRWLKNDAHSGAQTDNLLNKIRTAEESFLKKGMPLHIVNVTINETLDPRSNIEQRDRKGTGMAIGPAAISAGVLHHLVLGGQVDESPSTKAPNENSHVQVYPPDGQIDGSYRVFRYDQSPGKNRFDFGGEFLTLGNWTGVSGAAFSTSLGWRTSLGLSLLAGLANVRLTYWWNSGVKPARLGSRENWWRRGLSITFESFFSVQKFFFDELLARYRGTARQWWPLSDGGHFENLGGYELIRRRLPVIVIIDAEADPDYTFEGLSNLVRKARLDFGAEIRFLSEEELDECLHPEIRKQFGTLEQLRRGVWLEESTNELNGAEPENGRRKAHRRRSISPIEADALSLAHAALAEITYRDNSAKSKLVYVKPTLIGDESADVHRYHTEHPSFPHETTLQQFFDEAQWESYRQLGEHIAHKVFREPAPQKLDDTGKLVSPKLAPYKLLAPG